jgi:hypothetical protein
MDASTGPVRPTNYHESTDHLRGELCRASRMYRRAVDAAGDEDFPLGDLMAASYSYVIAAILGYARKYGTDVADDLAFEVDEILTNGDFDGLNADIWPTDDAEAEMGAGRMNGRTEAADMLQERAEGYRAKRDASDDVAFRATYGVLAEELTRCAEAVRP